MKKLAMVEAHNCVKENHDIIGRRVGETACQCEKATAFGKQYIVNPKRNDIRGIVKISLIHKATSAWAAYGGEKKKF